MHERRRTVVSGDPQALAVACCARSGATTSVTSPRTGSDSSAASTSPATAHIAIHDGYYWIMGRIDDVLNVAGHRLGTMEIESALVAHTRVAEAAVVGRPHEIKGESVFAYVVCSGPRPTGNTAAFEKELREWVSEQLGAIARAR